MRVILAVLVALPVLMSGMAMAADLAVLAQPGPWSDADRLTAYRGRIWFAASVKGVDHNSADIWSFEPSGKTLRFERYLFSQDAGRPVVHGGLLYWPHEDMREGNGTGAVSVTNGEAWQVQDVPGGAYMMHTHAVAQWDGKLVAAMAGWNSALATSGDGGATWNLLANEAPRTGSFHRFNGVAALGGKLFIRRWENTGYGLFAYEKGEIVPVEGWPRGVPFSDFVAHGEALYTLAASEGGAQLWRIDEDGPAPVDIEPSGMEILLIASDGERLWIATRDGTGGVLWSSRDGQVFKEGPGFSGGYPLAMAALSPGQIYVGGRGDNGRAILWGLANPAVKPDTAEPPALPHRPRRRAGGTEAEPERQRLVSALALPDTFGERGKLRAIITGALAKNPPEGFFAGLLDAPVAETDLELFGGNLIVPASEFATWHIIHAMGQNGERSVPARFLRGPWNRQPNRPQKWFDPLLIAMATIQRTTQNDRETVQALIDRLDADTDPDWLQSQVTGTLTAITGKRFAYDKTAWRSWWQAARRGWPEAGPAR